MQVKFQINGQDLTGVVVGQGHFRVDAPEFYEIEVNGYGFTKFVPMDECEIV